MGQWEKFRRRLLSGQADWNIGFADLCRYLERLGFTPREGQGSHKIFSRDGVDEIINLQPEGSVAKSYQARQVRVVIQKYELTEETTDEQA